MFSRVMFTGLAAVALVLAQGGDEIGVGMSNASRGSTPRVTQPTKGEQFVDKLKLNKEQKVEVQNILLASSKEAAPLLQQLSQARISLVTAMVNSRPQAEVDQYAKALTEVQLQVTGVELSAFQKVFALLKPNQTARAPEAFDVMAGIFEPVGGQGGMGGGRGPGGRGGR